MAKADKIQVETIPDEMLVLFAAVTLHAVISSGKSWSRDELVKYSFDIADAMVGEGRKRL